MRSYWKLVYWRLLAFIRGSLMRRIEMDNERDLILKEEVHETACVGERG